METIQIIKKEYKENSVYTTDVKAHGKKQRQLPLISQMDSMLKKAGYDMEDEFFHRYAELNGEIIVIREMRNGSLKLHSVDTDIETFIEYAENYRMVKGLAKTVAESTQFGKTPRINL